MQVYDCGCFVRVAVSAVEVAAFARSWPCCQLSGRIQFEFARSNGDLVEVVPESMSDREGIMGLLDDAQKYLRAWQDRRGEFGVPVYSPNSRVHVGDLVALRDDVCTWSYSVGRVENITKCRIRVRVWREGPRDGYSFIREYRRNDKIPELAGRACGTEWPYGSRIVTYLY